MPRPYWLIHCCDTGLISPANPTGLSPTILRGGWPAFMSERSDGWPSPDERIALHPFFVLSWPFGTFSNDKRYTVGRDLLDQHIGCNPRNPRDAAPESLKNFVGFWRERNAEIIRRKGESIVYVSPPPIGEKTNPIALAKYYAEIVDAGFTSVALDAAGSITNNGWKSGALTVAEWFLSRGLKVWIEGSGQIHPHLFPWRDGRFSCFMSTGFEEQEWNRPGYWNAKCSGVAPQWAVWLNKTNGAENPKQARVWASRGYSAVLNTYGVSRVEMQSLIADMAKVGA